jgi:ABC-type transport system substrate-binding protein
VARIHHAAGERVKADVDGRLMIVLGEGDAPTMGAPEDVSDFCDYRVEALLNTAHRAHGHLQYYWDQITKLWVIASPRIPLYTETYTAVLDKDMKYWTFSQQAGPSDYASWGR